MVPCNLFSQLESIPVNDDEDLVPISNFQVEQIYKGGDRYIPKRVDGKQTQAHFDRKEFIYAQDPSQSQQSPDALSEDENTKIYQTILQAQILGI